MAQTAISHTIDSDKGRSHPDPPSDDDLVAEGCVKSCADHHKQLNIKRL